LSTLTIGVTHHLLCPDAWSNPDEHERSLIDTVLPLPLAAVDLFGPLGLEPARVAREAAAVRDSGKRVVYTAPMLHHEPGCDASSPDPARRAAALALARRHLDAARQYGARLITFVSGADPGPADRARHCDAFADFLAAIAAEAAPLPVAVEPMDRDVDKRALVGPTAEAAAVIDQAQRRSDGDLGLLVDMAHVPLLGETFAAALAATGARLRHVHLGNCYLADANDPLYGDKHPPLAYPGGLHGPGELSSFMAALGEHGWLGSAEPTLSFEVRPAAGQTPAETLQQHVQWLQEAMEGLCAT